MPQPAIKEGQGSFTYADYLTWPDDERWEIIEGVVYDMTPAPTVRHQRILGLLHVEIATALKGRTCEVLLAPLDVRLAEGRVEDREICSVVQPDLLVVCDPKKLDRAGAVAAPELLVEILSPSTAFKDQTAKLSLYEKHGVQEYWIINPVRDTVQVYLLGDDGLFVKPEEFRKGETLDSRAVPALSVVLEKVFPDQDPDQP